MISAPCVKPLTKSTAANMAADKAQSPPNDIWRYTTHASQNRLVLKGIGAHGARGHLT